MSFDDFDRDFLPHSVMKQYFIDRRDKAKRRAEHHDRYEMRWRQQSRQEFKRKIAKTVETHSNMGIWGLQQIDDWMKKCQMYRGFHVKGVETFEHYQHRSWVELHKRTIECIRDLRQDMSGYIPGSFPNGYRIDPCTKMVPADYVDRGTCNLSKAIELGHLPQRFEYYGTSACYLT